MMRQLGDQISRRIARPLGWYLPGGATYADKVLSYSPIAYWPLTETSGPTAACLVNSAQNGAYVGATVGNGTGPDGQPCPWFDGTNDYVNIYSATLNSVFNGSEGSAMIWMKVNAAGVWTDGASRYAMMLTATDSYVLQGKNNANDTLIWVYRAGGTSETTTKNPVTGTDWIQLFCTWSKSNDRNRIYYNASLENTRNTLGNWGGGLSATGTVIGAQTTAPLSPFHGWCAHGAIWNTELQQPAITDLYDPNP